MTEKAFPRRIYLPPPGRPRWQPPDPAGWELLYLSWGRRWFGDHPIPPAMHEGWAYCAVLEGAPRAMIDGRGRPTRVGRVFLFHPDCAYGWSDRPRRACRTLTWLWRTPPAHSALVPPAGGCRSFLLDRPQLSHLVAIHTHCREAVASPGETGVLALRKARLELDLHLAAAAGRGGPANAQFRMNLAVQYLRHNPAKLDPVGGLCEYLQVSPATLKKLFHAQAGRSPRAFALEQRMRLARERLAAGRPVKEVAYGLGYRHPNDFSRAFKRHFGAPAQRLCTRGKSG